MPPARWPFAFSIISPDVLRATQLEKDYAEICKGLNRALGRENGRRQQARAAIGVIDFSSFKASEIEVNGFTSLI
ncbi:hypothetical protein DGo_PC0282 (plasmid) [Deinococcus gobiensis I-0]|uniref:Uncharacterized protein n=1 Tax=Deinococcus gobiensis (strain DSM 21396 / JCM 16679 / CGMCC 1.7299 / I-0) TaxID=745776 RepID=H8H3H7_DEIGI|nr:hypothetical protein DGo_PC0282 [Deinococcus gobiensis I-0]